MRGRRFRIAIAMLAVAVTLPTACRPPSIFTARQRAVIDSLFIPFSAPGMPGASMVVVRNGVVVVDQAFGLASVNPTVHATTRTNYRLASVSKQFTATAILLLVQDGKLTLDTPARSILAELPAYASGVTVRNLLTHTSGLWDYESFVPDSQSWQVKDRDALSLVASHAESLYFAPGSAWRYSNTGYALLALIVERVSGKRYADFLRERIFDQIGMRNTLAFEQGVSTVPDRAYGHTVRRGVVERTDQSTTSAVLGDGGIYSSVEDLVRWDAAIASNKLVQPPLWHIAVTPFVLSGGTATNYGFGWFIDRYAGRERMYHHGETMGFTNAIARFPAERLTIVVLTNRSDSAPWTIVDRLADLFLAQ